MDRERLVRAVLMNIDDWIRAAHEIADTADNDACRKPYRLALHHAANLMTAKRSLQRFLGDAEDDFRWLEKRGAGDADDAAGR